MTKNHGNTAGFIRNFIVDKILDGQSITDDEDLLLSGMISSIGIMRLVAFIQTTFDVEIPAQDVTVENMATVTAIMQYLEPLLD